MGNVILGSEAVRAGEVTRHELRRSYTTLYRGVYVRKGVVLTLRERALGAWLATGRKGVLAEVAASALHGAPWVDPAHPICITGVKSLPQPGLITRAEHLAVDEVTRRAGLPVTTRIRTAFDLGRHLDRTEALERLDALMWNQRFDIADVAALAEAHKRARGVCQLRGLLQLIDGGAASPRESRIRLALLDHGFPRPETQIPVLRGSRPIAFLDLGWRQYGVAVEYDGDHHRKVRRQYVRDIERLRMLEQEGWVVVRVIAEDRSRQWLARVEDALRRRGCPLDVNRLPGRAA